MQENIDLQHLMVSVITDGGVCRQVAWQVHPVLAAVQSTQIGCCSPVGLQLQASSYFSRLCAFLYLTQLRRSQVTRQPCYTPNMRTSGSIS